MNMLTARFEVLQFALINCERGHMPMGSSALGLDSLESANVVKCTTLEPVFQMFCVQNSLRPICV